MGAETVRNSIRRSGRRGLEEEGGWVSGGERERLRICVLFGHQAQWRLLSAALCVPGIERAERTSVSACEVSAVRVGDCVCVCVCW